MENCPAVVGLWKIQKVMQNFSHASPFLKTALKEFRLIYRAKSGDAHAFVNLYDAYVEHVYRYIYFLVPNNKAAEGLTFQVFFKAREYLDRYRLFNSSLVIWLYSIAKNQVFAYYSTHKEAVEPENDFTMAIRGGDFREEFQLIRDGLRFLTFEQQQVLVLKFIAGMSNKKISRVITSNGDDVRVLQLLGLQALAEHLNGTELMIDD